MAEKKEEKVSGKFTIKNNLFVADEDVFVTKEDGRQILAAKAGTTLGLERAEQLGAISRDEMQTEAKKADEKANKSTSAPENKSK